MIESFRKKLCDPSQLELNPTLSSLESYTCCPFLAALILISTFSQ